jgi:hypothetical protein
MALTGTLIQRLPGIGAEDLKLAKVTGDSSYVTGGYPVTPALFQFSAFATDGLGTGLPPVVGAYQLIADLQGPIYSVINPANGNLQFFTQTTGAEVASASNQSTTAAIISAYGH